MLLNTTPLQSGERTAGQSGIPHDYLNNGYKVCTYKHGHNITPGSRALAPRPPLPTPTLTR